MLRVVYQAATLKAGQLSDWSESRGLLTIYVAQGVPAKDFIPSLNDTLRECLSRAHWYQIWDDGEIISVSHPESPLRCTYAVSPFEQALPVDIREHKGHVALYVPPMATIEEIAPTLNTSIEEFLAGGRWFQLWHGEIITVDSPGSAAA
jgi:hypothetical protein